MVGSLGSCVVGGERLTALAAFLSAVATRLRRLVRDGTAGEAKVAQARTSIVGEFASDSGKWHDP